ncbi:MAG: helix-turn-helix transcriptional regulator [Deltaproteobacteria bacterium]|nr:helix-turn-helix transcriptional regulator [Deltaproteobacteria bacterium]
MLVGEKIKKLRELKEISRYRLSKDTGIPYTTLTDIESGKVKTINNVNLKLVSNALGIPVSELLD